MNNDYVAQLLTYGWVVLLSALGGLVAFIRKLNHSRTPQPLSIIFLKLGGELLISAFAGLITYWLCLHWAWSSPMTATAVAISGHLGGKTIDGVGRMWLAVLDNAKFKED